MARGIHHFITSSGQKANGNLARAPSAMVVGTGRIAICSSALTVNLDSRLLGVFRVEAAFPFFFL